MSFLALPTKIRTKIRLDGAPIEEPPLTSAILQISYDGSHFTGWSSANDGNMTRVYLPFKKKGRGKRKRGALPSGSGFVRSVQGELTYCLAKLYGNVDPNRIVLEGCSRTDKGVGALGHVAQIYCLSEDGPYQPTIPGKRLPHPLNATDSSYFLPLPVPLPKLAFTLNRMLADDVRVRSIAPTPTLEGSFFHPTVSSISKTYKYRFSSGTRQDPTQRRSVWYVAGFEVSPDVTAGCKAFVGTHSFAAFQGAARSSSDKVKRESQDTFCRINSVEITETDSWLDTKNYEISITGDRFLYKQVRFMVGAIVAIGRGALTVAELGEMLESEMRSYDFECAPALGLLLTDVQYDCNIGWIRANE